MTALKWRSAGKDSRVAEGHSGTWYELVRESPKLSVSGTWWIAWFCETGIGRSRRLAAHVNFIQARRACIDHHNRS